ncbi:MAG TPA: hypothetical protein VF147_16035 [Vicinamibacterales bacterium]
MSPLARLLTGCLVLFLSASSAWAQGSSSLWLVAGGASATVRGGCQECEEDAPYRHSGSLLFDVGRRVNPRMDVGAEVFWVPVNTSAGHLRATHVDAVAQFRPWVTKGFFLKGGAGMAFVRDWIDVPATEPVTSKALSVVIGAGWEFRPGPRVGFQVFGAQHAAALGDLRTGSDTVANDVMGNFWSLGAAIVIR